MTRYKRKYKKSKTPKEMQEEWAHKYLKEKYVSYRVADHILNALMFGFLTVGILTSPFGLLVIVKGAGNYVFRKEDFDREINRFEKKGFVALTKTEKQYKIRLFKTARRRKLKAKVNLMQLPVEDHWDGLYRFVIFDIPEEHRTRRDRLRKKLKSLGMFNAQRSVLVYPYECRKEVDLITEYYKVGKYATYAVVSSCDIDKELRKHFKLR